MNFRLLKPFLPGILVGCAIFWLSVSSGVQVPDVGISIDKIGHLGAYGLLAWLFLFGLKWSDRYGRRRAIWTVVWVSVYGILLEFVQWAFFPHRFFEVWDMIANITGAFTSYLLFRFFIHKT